MIDATRINWYRNPIDKDVLRLLNARNNWQPLLHVLTQISLSATTAFLAYFSWRNLAWPLTILLIWVHGSIYTFFGYAGGAHELSHRNVFRSRWLNEVVMVVYDFLSWGNFVCFRHSHMKHHQLTVHNGRDMEVELPMEVPPAAWFWAFTFNIPSLWRVLKTRVRWAAGHLEGEWEHFIFPQSDQKGRRRLFWWSRIELAGHLALAIFFVVSGNWILLFLVTFGRFIGQWLNFLVGVPQHIGLKPDVPDFRICCRTFLIGPLVRFLYWNMNYHVEHHMFASVPFYRLRQLHREIAWDLPIPRIGIIDVWREIIPIIRRQQEDPSYALVPALPEGAQSARTRGR